jgi:hypothetical protein
MNVHSLTFMALKLNLANGVRLRVRLLDLPDDAS